jgi:hypothetical protein
MIQDNVPVYNKREINGVYGMHNHRDIIRGMQGLLARGDYKIDFDGCMKRVTTGMGYETPWWHHKGCTTKRCHVDHGIKFYNFNYIPPRCLECWKVVAMPRTLKELYTVREVQKQIDKPSKCGIELRFYTPRNYGAYWYTNHLDQGWARYEQVRKAIDESIGEDVEVVLKRGCTEFELIGGPSPYWCMTAEQEEMDQYIEDRLEVDAIPSFTQADYVLHRTQKHWIEWAAKQGDQTYLEFTDGKPLYAPAVRYEVAKTEEERATVKADLSRARMGKIHGTEGHQVDLLADGIEQIKEAYDVNEGQLGTLLGYADKNPLIARGVLTY